MSGEMETRTRHKRDTDRRTVARTPAQAEEAFTDDAVAQTACHGHVGLPRFRQHPAERRQEEEVEESSDKSAHHLRGVEE